MQSLFYFFTLYFEETLRVTPSLPQRGRQPKGSIPLTPALLLFFSEYFLSTFCGDIVRNFLILST